MSRYYGTVEGIAKGKATRRGSMTKGLTVTAQSYDGSLLVHMHDGPTTLDAPRVALYVGQGSTDSTGHATKIFDGTLYELLRALAKVKDYRKRNRGALPRMA